MSRYITLPAVVSGLLLAGCGSELANDQAAQNLASPQASVATAPDATRGVNRDRVEAEQPAVTAMAPMPVIQSQPGPDGTQLDLLSVRVTGDILTVTLRCTSDERFNTKPFRVSQISVIDDTTSQQLSVLTDNEGTPLVSNYQRGSSRDNSWTSTNCGSRPGVLWAKFPAPPPTSATVSINLPQVGPFDGIPVQR